MLCRCVIAVTRIGMLYSSSATWPCDSPNGASGSTVFGVDQPLDHDLRFGGDQQIDGLRPHDVDRRAGEAAGDGELVDADRQLLRPHEGDVGRAAEHDRARHRLVAALLVLEVVLIAAGTADARCHAHHQAVGRFQRRAVGAHVLHAGLGIARDDVGRGERGRAVEAGRRDRDRQAVEPLAFALQRLALQHDLVARRGRHEPGGTGFAIAWSHLAWMFSIDASMPIE